MKLHGIYVPTVVPLRKNGSLNEEELSRHLIWLANKGVDGIYANGSTGEFTRFTQEERRRTIEIVAQAASGRLGIIAGAVEGTHEETLSACTHYAELGCDAVSLCPPVYFRIGQDALCEHYLRLAEKSPIPILLYNIPAFATQIACDTICELAKHPRIVGVKDSSRDFPGFLNLMREIRSFRPDFIFFTGTEEILLPALFMGANGGTIATAGCLPEAITTLYHAWKNGDIATAQKLQMALLPLIKLMFSIDFPLGFRAAIELRGFGLGPCRQPLSATQQKAIVELKDALQPIMNEILDSIIDNNDKLN